MYQYYINITAVEVLRSAVVLSSVLIYVWGYFIYRLHVANESMNVPDKVLDDDKTAGKNIIAVKIK